MPVPKSVVPALLAAALALPASAPAADAPLRATMGLTGADLTDQTSPFIPAEPLGDVTGDGRAELALLQLPTFEDGDDGITTLTVSGQTTHENVDLGGASSRLLKLPGYAVEGAGDVNGDGIGDVLVTGPAPGLPGDFGTAVVFGGPDLNRVNLARLGNRGFYVANGFVRRAGDLNDDGREELVGAAFDEPDGAAAKLVLIAGRRTGGIVVDLRSVGTRGIDLPDSAMPNLPETAHGDVNGDGVDDLVIHQQSWPTKLTVLFGGRGFTAISPNSPGNRGVEVTGEVATLGRIPGDVTGDGRDDLLVRTSDGVTRIVPGPSGPGVIDARAGGITLDDVPSSNVEVPVAGVGDLTEDGRDDLVARTSGGGAVFITGRPAPATVTDALRVPGSFGVGAVFAVGDVDGDGRDDAMQLGAPAAAFGFPGATLLTAGADVLPPRWAEGGPLVGLSVEPAAFKVGPGATSLQVLLSEPATAEVMLRTAGGALVGKLDVPLQQAFSRASWDGRINGRELPPGDYRSSVTPVDASGNRGETKTVAFTVLP